MVGVTAEIDFEKDELDDVDVEKLDNLLVLAKFDELVEAGTVLIDERAKLEAFNELIELEKLKKPTYLL